MVNQSFASHYSDKPTICSSYAHSQYFLQEHFMTLKDQTAEGLPRGGFTGSNDGDNFMRYRLEAPDGFKTSTVVTNDDLEIAPLEAPGWPVSRSLNENSTSKGSLLLDRLINSAGLGLNLLATQTDESRIQRKIS
jgi:hypothetical protein